MNNLIAIQNNFTKEFKLDFFENWFYDSESSILRLYNSNEDEIFFHYIPIGTFSKNSQTWMWSWFNENSIESNKDETPQVQQFGIKGAYPKLIEGTFDSDVFDVWEFLAISFSILRE